MRYCRTCVTPDTRPHLVLDETGQCNACIAHGTKRTIDWKKRKRIFGEVVKHAKKRSRGYDAMIPVSGGKDSTWQVVKCLEYGLNILALTWRTPARTEIGQKNLDNLIRLGVDHIDYQISPKVEKKFLYQALTKYGSTGIPMHMAMFNIPPRVAVRFGIPLIIWGENPAFEYGGSKEESQGFVLDQKWFKKFGVTHGTTAKDWVSSKLTQKELTPYFAPTSQELARSGSKGIFLGYYFQWDPVKVVKVAEAHGFQARKAGSKTGYYNFADIDDDFISLHHYLKWHKFGFTRLFDNLSLEIRNGRITRDRAIQIIRKMGDQTPHEDIEKFCEFVGISMQRFFAICENFRNRKIWVKKRGKWMIPNFIIPDWKW
jgi:N-acetyl sugar amidotransferase